MRNAMKLITAGTLAACAALAQEKSESVDGVLKQLGTHTAAPAVSETAVAVEAAPSAEAEIDVNATIEESRDAYAGGEFERAQSGFEAVIKKDPENLIARTYLRKLLERDARKAEVSGIKAVSAGWKTDLVVRSYDISEEAAQKMELKGDNGAVDVVAKFPEVKFPKGSSAIYQPKLGKLFVRNTCENLQVLEEIVAAMDVAKLSSDIDQVEIETKFIEVSEGTLEALGFEWRSIAGQPIDVIDGVTIPGGQYLFDDALRGSPGNTQSGPGLPFSQPNTLGAGSTGVSGDWTAFRMEDTFNASSANMRLSKGGSTPLDVLISALDQSSGTDVLSAPRVVTVSGEKATIRVGQLHYYPEVYEVSASGGNIVHVKYEDWAEKLLGVELAVTPQVDGEQIEMELNPKLYELQGMQNYEVAPINSAYTWYQYRVGFRYTHDPIVAQLPILRKREISTEVTIADGATIGMGGLINEKVESYEDRVPFLGSIPLVGRLFRNEGERAIKRNLLIFVTAKKIEPSGRVNTSRSFE
jgi:general secretion pathway protein D